MSSLRSMSPNQAVSEATNLAASFLAGENAKGFTSELDGPAVISIDLLERKCNWA